MTIAVAAEKEAAAGAGDESEALKLTEARRIERLTWFAVVVVLVVPDVLPDWLSLHYGATPLAAGLVFLVSGLMRQRVGFMRPSIWVAGVVLLVFAGFNFVSRPDLNLSLNALLCAAAVIALSVFVRKG